MNEVTNMSEDNNDVRPDVLSALVAEIRSLREENARRNAELEELPMLFTIKMKKKGKFTHSVA
ncbi:hypothetical protein E5D57_013117 [Metarhizium anisopliae]|nr:hypothetical protein E5D57_013117 [Metarhizium anisopliae]